MKNRKKLDKALYDYYKNSPRDKWELIIDKHNHKLELIRTIGNVFSGLGGILAILRIFNII